MNINSISLTEGKQQTFCALLVESSYMKSLKLQMSKQPGGAELVKDVYRAFANYPQKVRIKVDKIERDGFWSSRGTVSSKYTTLVDTEPANNNRVHSIKNIIRRILDPQNKESFIKLVGENNPEVYDSWWNDNVAPIWQDINTKFREKTFFNKNYDELFNKDFRAQKETAWQKIFALKEDVV